MKKIYTVFLSVLICLFFTSCGIKSNAPEFADEMFVKLSYTPVDIRSEEYIYTMNIEIYQDMSACIYADDFIKWYGEDEPERVWITLSEQDIKDIKKCINDNKLYEIQRDVGNKDDIAGVRKSITVYTKDSEYSISGLSPSNKNFNAVYDLITDKVRTKVTNYTDGIEEIQKKGKADDVGIYITNETDSIVFGKTDITDIYVEELFEGEKATDTDAESEVQNSLTMRIVFGLDDSVKEDYEKMTFYLNEDEFIVLKLYNDKKFVMNLLAYNETDGIKVYSGNVFYDEEEINELIEELKEGLE